MYVCKCKCIDWDILCTSWFFPVQNSTTQHRYAHCAFYSCSTSYSYSVYKMHRVHSTQQNNFGNWMQFPMKFYLCGKYFLFLRISVASKYVFPFPNFQIFKQNRKSVCGFHKLEKKQFQTPHYQLLDNHFQQFFSPCRLFLVFFRDSQARHSFNS